MYSLDLLTRAPGLSNGISFTHSIDYSSSKKSSNIHFSNFDLSETLFGEDAIESLPNPTNIAEDKTVCFDITDN